MGAKDLKMKIKISTNYRGAKSQAFGLHPFSSQHAVMFQSTSYPVLSSFHSSKLPSRLNHAHASAHSSISRQSQHLDLVSPPKSTLEFADFHNNCRSGFTPRSCDNFQKSGRKNSIRTISTQPKHYHVQSTRT